MNEQMTNEQMKDRIKEINRERERLDEEKRVYENLLNKEKVQKAIEEHQTHIGEYYKTSHMFNEKQNYIKAFKILNVLDKPNESYAECLVVFEGTRSNCWNESGIEIMTLGLWSSNRLRMMSCDSDPKVIDCCQKITKEEFEQLFDEHMKKMKENL